MRAKAYKSARGKGGLVRATWDEAVEIVAAAHVHTIKKYGPDRVAGFSPIPAMSMVSHASGARFCNLIGGSMLSFYDWYADLPVASPQVFGDQTDVPESGDWWDAGYLIMWGSNLPVTRTPDAHWMAEARYRGQKVIAVAPDYADNVKFADEWLPAAPGTDGALAMAMGHVILKEFFVDRRDAVLHRLREELHRPAAPGPARDPTARVTRPSTPQASSSPPPTSTSTQPRRTPPSRRSCSTRAPARPSSPTAPWATGTATPASAAGTSTSATWTRCSRCSTAPRSRSWSGCRASTPPTARPRHATRRTGPAHRRTPGHHCLRPPARPVRRRALGRRQRLPGEWAERVRRRRLAVHPGLAGDHHRRAGRDSGAGSPASSPRTPRSPTAAR